MNQYYVPDNDNDWKALFLKTDGRLNRLRYFKRQMLLLLIVLILVIFVGVACDNGYGYLTQRGERLESIIGLCYLLVSYFLDVRRLHDIGKDSTIAKVILGTGLLSLFESLGGLADIAQLVSAVGSLYLFFTPGTQGPNQYGADPLGPTMTMPTENAEQTTNQNNASDIADTVSNLTGNSQNNIVNNNGASNLNNLSNPEINSSNSLNTNVDAEDEAGSNDDDDDDDDDDLF